MIRESEGISGETDLSRGVNFYDEVRKFEMDLIRRALDQTGGHQSRAARLLGLNATTLNSKIKIYNILARNKYCYIKIYLYFDLITKNPNFWV